MAQPAALDGRVYVRPAVWRDRGVVRRIECACFGRARLLFGLWSRTGGRDAMVWLGEMDGTPAGYLVAYKKDLDGRPALYVGGVGVLKPFRKSGIGTCLMNAVFAEQYPVWLHVRASNMAAIALYRKLGMCERRRATGFYTSGEDALVMATPCEG